MKPKTTAGKTVPCPTQHDCDLLDRTIDLVLLYREYEHDEDMGAFATIAIDKLRGIAERCNALRE